MQPCKTIQVHGWAVLPNIPCHGPADFAALKDRFVLMLCKLLTKLKRTDGHAPPNTVPLNSRCGRLILFGWYEAFQKRLNEWLNCAPQTRPSSFPGVEELFRLDVKPSSLWLGRAPQHPLSRPSSFRGVEESFRFGTVQTFNNVQMNGKSCSPKHRPGHFTVLKNYFIWIVWNFSFTVELMVGPCSPKHGPVLFTVLMSFFFWILCSHVKTFKFMAGPHFPTSLVTAQLISRRWKIVSPWCWADFQQRSNERLVVLPQTRSSPFHGVENFSHLDGMKLFKNVRTYGWYVLPQTRPSSFHGVEELFRLDVMLPIKHNQVDGWVALPNIPCHGPAHFAALKNRFVLMLCKHSTTFKRTDDCAPPNTVQGISRCWKTFSSGWYETF